ncbi:MAG: hypothetical protein B6I28_06380 [Fusobacteriia bacterium 4572_132]|nr:MAG: hypothetical protein B6I28_06380 [Fusobacteriia bacterium 4572_132]
MKEFKEKIITYEKIVKYAKDENIKDIDFELAKEKISFLKNSYRLNINLIEEVNKEINEIQKKLILNHRTKTIVKEISTFKKYLKEKYNYDLVLKDEVKENTEKENLEEIFKVSFPEGISEKIFKVNLPKEINNKKERC